MKDNHWMSDKQKKALEDYLKKEVGNGVRLDYVTLVDGIVFSQGSSESRARDNALAAGIHVSHAHYKYGTHFIKEHERKGLAIGYDLRSKKILSRDEVFQRLSENYSP